MMAYVKRIGRTRIWRRVLELNVKGNIWHD
jgi:hypothetical protein